jgi:hypothetical protein
MADGARLARLLGGGGSARRVRTAATGSRLDLHLIGVEQIRDGLFPRWHILVADDLFFTQIVVAGFFIGSRLWSPGSAPGCHDLLRFVIFILDETGRATIRRGTTPAIVRAAAVAPTTRFRGGSIRFRFSGGLPRHFDSRFGQVVGQIGFRSGGIIPIPFWDGGHCRWAAWFTFRASSSAPAPAAPPVFARPVSLSAGLRTVFAGARAALTPPRFAVRWGRFHGRLRCPFGSRQCLATNGSRRRLLLARRLRRRAEARCLSGQA